jgi:hypothetical protein
MNRKQWIDAVASVFIQYGLPRYQAFELADDAYDMTTPLQYFKEDIKIPECPDLITRYGRLRIVDGKVELIHIDKVSESDTHD